MRTDKNLWRNRKAKKELARRMQSENPGLEVVHPHAAGIDVGNGVHYCVEIPWVERGRRIGFHAPQPGKVDAHAFEVIFSQRRGLKFRVARSELITLQPAIKI